jgi:hypothetical protein
MRHVNKILSFLFIIVFFSFSYQISADDYILYLLPEIIAVVEKRPPPPARWRVTNEVACSSFKSLWTVNDGVNSRSSRISSRFASPATSDFAEVEPGQRTFTWILDTTLINTTCGTFRNSFSQDLKRGFDYRFILGLGSNNSLEIRTIETYRNLSIKIEQ